MRVDDDWNPENNGFHLDVSKIHCAPHNHSTRTDLQLISCTCCWALGPNTQTLFETNYTKLDSIFAVKVVKPVVKKRKPLVFCFNMPLLFLFSQSFNQLYFVQR